jgi:hypothetical protein
MEVAYFIQGFSIHDRKGTDLASLSIQRKLITSEVDFKQRSVHSVQANNWVTTRIHIKYFQPKNKNPKKRLPYLEPFCVEIPLKVDDFNSSTKFYLFHR